MPSCETTAVSLPTVSQAGGRVREGGRILPEAIDPYDEKLVPRRQLSSTKLGFWPDFERYRTMPRIALLTGSLSW